MARPEAGTTSNPSEIPHGNPLARFIEEKIQKTGPISFDEYMSAWLYGVVDSSGAHIPGYYTGDHVKIDNGQTGELGDFLTPPELSPLYGFAIAKQIKQMWEIMGRPEDFKVVEMGAGNGTLAATILTGLKDIQDRTKEAVFDNVRYIVIERSNTLLDKQKATLSEFREKVDLIKGNVYEDIPLKGVKGVVLSTELVDAFPVKIVRKNEDDFEELYVDNKEGDYFKEEWRPISDKARNHIEKYMAGVGWEKPCSINIASTLWMEQVSQMLSEGYVVTVDYGALGGKQPVSLFSELRITDKDRDDNYLSKELLGETDITASVDFNTLHSAGKKSGLKTRGLVNQKLFLYGLGFDELLYAAKKNMTDDDNFVLNNRSGSMELAQVLYRNAHWYVLLQSKNITSSDRLLGLV